MAGVTPELGLPDDFLKKAKSATSMQFDFLQELSTKLNEHNDVINEHRNIIDQLNNTVSNLATEVQSVKTMLQDITENIKEAVKLDLVKSLTDAWFPGQFIFAEDHQNQNQSSLRKTSGTDDSQLTSAKPMTGSLITSQNTPVPNELSDASQSASRSSE